MRLGCVNIHFDGNKPYVINCMIENECGRAWNFSVFRPSLEELKCHSRTSIAINIYSQVAFLYQVQQVKTKYCSGMAQAVGYFDLKFCQWKHWSQVTSRLSSLESSDDFHCACVCVGFHFHLDHLLRLRRNWKPGFSAANTFLT